MIKSDLLSSKFDYTRLGLILFPFVLPLPVPMIVKSIALILFAFILLLNNTKLNIKNIFSDKIVILFFLLFFLDPISSFIRNEDLYFRELRISFLFIPALCLVNKDLLKKYKKKILSVYVVGVFGYLFLATLYIIYFYSVNPEKFALDYFLKYVTYNFFPNAIHHTYFGIYICFAAAILFLDKNLKNHLKFLLISILFFAIFILGSKFSIIFFMIVLPIFISFTLKFSYIKKFLILFTFITIGIFTISYFYLKTDLFRTLVNSTKNREILFECSLRYIEGNFFYGIGNKNVKTFINECNHDIGEMDTHNIFLQELLANGILGAVILFLIMIFLYKEFVKNKNWLGVLLVFMLLLFGLVEHLLNLQNGVTFFVYFLALLRVTNYNLTINKV